VDPHQHSLIAFGFTIFKFLQYLATQEHRHTIVSPWVVGMANDLIGLTGLALAWIQQSSADEEA